MTDNIEDPTDYVRHVVNRCRTGDFWQHDMTDEQFVAGVLAVVDLDGRLKPDYRRWACREIASDAAADVERFEGKPFTGKTVAEYMGAQAAGIAALARIVESLLPASSSEGPPPWSQEAVDDQKQ